MRFLISRRWRWLLRLAAMLGLRSFRVGDYPHSRNRQFVVVHRKGHLDSRLCPRLLQPSVIHALEHLQLLNRATTPRPFPSSTCMGNKNNAKNLVGLSIFPSTYLFLGRTIKSTGQHENKTFQLKPVHSLLGYRFASPVLLTQCTPIRRWHDAAPRVYFCASFGPSTS